MNAISAVSPPSPAGQGLTLYGITHVYQGGMIAVDDVTLDVKAGELVALLGPSGCGKTTLLRIVAGFIQHSHGKVVVGGREIDELPPHKRTIGIVFQNYALFPHMSVADNVAYGLAARGVSRKEQKERVEEMLALVQLSSMAERYPRQLSGGQQQRIALARALAVKPQILLLDEPFAALDKNLRLDMQIEIKRIQRLAGTTTLMVTHDQEEALSMADRVAVLSKGKLEQFSPPTEVYDRPASFFVNTFVGTANVLEGELVSVQGSEGRVSLQGGSALVGRLATDGLSTGDKVRVCLRPEHVAPCAPSDADALTGTVEMGLPLGAGMVHEIRLSNGLSLKMAEPREQMAQPRPPGATVTLKPINPQSAAIYPA